jgi:hypothetical protein
MECEFSEFSYGYAAIRQAEADLTAVFSQPGPPLQPSLRDEASLGWDVGLLVPGFVAFMQFKLSEFIVRGRRDSPTWPAVGAPHHRFAIDTTHHQFEALLLLENRMRRGRIFGDVLYLAPCFSKYSQFDEAYRNGAVLTNSMMASPHEFAGLPPGWHYYVTDSHGVAQILSDPTPVESPRTWEYVLERARRGSRRRRFRDGYRLYHLISFIAGVAEELGMPIAFTDEHPPLLQLQRFAQLLGCHLVLPLWRM